MIADNGCPTWLLDGAALLGEPDPGPTPWLVTGLVVEQALTAVVGRWKTTKSWAMLELALSIATGTRAFGVVEIPEAGPVVYVMEESGKRPLRRRLDMLCRGRGAHPDELRGRLLLAPNQRVKLDDPDWQARLIETGLRLRPRAFIFDPLARMKDAARVENDQSGMAPVIEFLRMLRDETQAAPMFVHHTGHQGEHMRGSSDLESAWESRLTLKRDTDNGIVTVNAEHREEEDGAAVTYRLDFDREARTMHLRPSIPPLAERIIDHLRDHGPMGAAELAKGIETRRSDVDRTLAALEAAGTTHRAPSGKPDASGRHNPAKVWHLNNHAAPRLVPEPGRNGTSQTAERAVCPCRPAPLGADDGRHAKTDEPQHALGGDALPGDGVARPPNAARARDESEPEPDLDDVAGGVSL